MDEAAALDEASLRELEDWLVGEGLTGERIDDLVRQFGDRLYGAGFPLLRLFIGLNTLHPLYHGFGYAWKRGETFTNEPFLRSNKVSDGFLKSPFFHMFQSGVLELRKSLDESGGLEFEIYDSFRALGATDYLARLIGFGPQSALGKDAPGERRDGMMVSCLIDGAGGYSDAALTQIRRLTDLLAVTVRGHAANNVARNIAQTYLGKDPGNRVLNGEITRGSVQKIRAVIFFADLRGFTRLSDRVPPDELVPLLDDYLEVMARPVLKHGGEVLKFLGDGLLGVFDINGEQSAGECSRALIAAREAITATEALNVRRRAEGKDVMALDVALHVGDVHYGNVGAEERLEFTVIGPAVNEASRLEALCKPLGHALLTSAAFAASATHCRGELVSVGAHELRDLDGPREIFTFASDRAIH